MAKLSMLLVFTEGASVDVLYTFLRTIHLMCNPDVGTFSPI